MTAAPEKFTKKPVQIEAMQWDGTAQGATPIIDWILSHDGNARFDDYTMDSALLLIRTLEGDMAASAGWWIIRGVEGEFYPCKDSVFVATYDRKVGENDYARIYTDNAGEWRYQVFAGNHRQIDKSEDGKASRVGVLRELKREWPHITNISERREGQ